MGLRSWLAHKLLPVEQEVPEEVKMNPTYQLIVETMGGDRPIYSEKNFRTIAEVGFSKNIYVFRAVTMIAQACAGIPWKVYSKRSDEEITNHALIDLIQKPNSERSWAEVVETFVAFEIIAGNSYINVVYPKTRKGTPLELWPLPPDRVAIIPHPDGSLSYEYTVNGMTKKYRQEEIMHLKIFNATNDLYGMSPILVASTLVDQMNEGNDWNTALLQNSARPSGALAMSSTLSDDAFRRLRRQILEKYSGKKNAGKPLLLEGGLQWQQFSLSPVEMNWLQGKQELAKEIAVALGVPPEMLGSTQNRTYSNFSEARKSFYTETILPLMDKIQGYFNMWLVPKFGSDIELRYDREDIEALHDAKDVITSRATSLFKGSIITFNEAREMVGQTTVPYGEFIYLPEMKRAIALTALEEFLETNLQLGPGAADIGSPQPITSTQTPTTPLLPSAFEDPLEEDASTDQQGNSAGREGSGKKWDVYSTKKLYTHNEKAHKKEWIQKIASQIEDYLSSELSSIQKTIEGAPLPELILDRVRFTLKKQSDVLSTLTATSYLAICSEVGKSSLPHFNVWSQELTDVVASKAPYQVSSFIHDSFKGIEKEVKEGISYKLTCRQIQDEICTLYSPYAKRERAKEFSSKIIENAFNIIEYQKMHHLISKPSSQEVVLN